MPSKGKVFEPRDKDKDKDKNSEDVRLNPSIAEEKTKRKALLDVIIESVHKQKKTEFVDRLVYVAKLTDNIPNRKDIGAYFEGFFNRYHNELGAPESAVTTSITGILLVLQQTCIHLMEGPPKVIRAHLRDLNSMKAEKRMLDDIKIIMSTEDVPQRSFPCWVCRAVNIGRVTNFEPEPEDIEHLLAECYMNLLQLGQNLSGQDKLEEALDSLRSKYRDLLPSNERLVNFIQTSVTFELQEWLNMYDTPVDLALERDLEWPIPS